MNQVAFDTLTRIEDWSDLFVVTFYFVAFVSLLAFSCITAEAICRHWANAQYLRSIRRLVRSTKRTVKRNRKSNPTKPHNFPPL